MRTIAELNNKHKGEACWIMGSGPSLDNLSHNSITGPRIYINQVAFVLPALANETYWMVNDDAWARGLAGSWDEHLKALLDGNDMIGVFRNPMYWWKLGAKGSFAPNWIETQAPQGDNVIYWDGSKPVNDEALCYTRDEVTTKNMLYSRQGSLCVAVHLAWYMGCDKIKLSGFDGTNGRADMLKHEYRITKPSASPIKYRPHKKLGLDAAEYLQLKVEDYSLGRL